MLPDMFLSYILQMFFKCILIIIYIHVYDIFHLTRNKKKQGNRINPALLLHKENGYYGRCVLSLVFPV